VFVSGRPPRLSRTSAAYARAIDDGPAVSDRRIMNDVRIADALGGLAFHSSSLSGWMRMVNAGSRCAIRLP
jgi:hypothetical protein